MACSRARRDERLQSIDGTRMSTVSGGDAAGDAPLRLALLASEQILPNLESALALAAAAPLASVHIYWTSVEVSAKPAQRIEQLLAGMRGRRPFCHFEIHRAAQAGSGSIEAVRRWLLQTFQQLPGSRWVLTATGGTTPMAAAMFDLLGHAAVDSVIYREMGAAGWQSFARDPVSGPLTRNAPAALGLDRAGEYLDLVGIHALVEAQVGQQNVTVRSAEAPALAPELLGELIKNLRIDAAKPFRDAWLACCLPLPASQGEGVLFELICRGVLELFGLAETLHSLELLHEATGRNEIDLIAKHRGRIVVLDLKLRDDKGSATPPYDQIRNAAEATRKLGGLSARCLMLRPNWPADPARARYARDVHRVGLLDASCNDALFRHIAEALGWQGSLPAQAVALQEFLAARRDRAGAAAASDSKQHGHDPIYPFVIDVDKEMSDSALLLGRNWCVLRIAGGDLLLRVGPLPEGVQGVEVAERLRAMADSASGEVLPLGPAHTLLLLRGFKQQALLTKMQVWPAVIFVNPKWLSRKVPKQSEAPNRRLRRW